MELFGWRNVRDGHRLVDSSGGGPQSRQNLHDAPNQTDQLVKHKRARLGPVPLFEQHLEVPLAGLTFFAGAVVTLWAVLTPVSSPRLRR